MRDPLQHDEFKYIPFFTNKFIVHKTAGQKEYFYYIYHFDLFKNVDTKTKVQ